MERDVERGILWLNAPLQVMGDPNTQTIVRLNKLMKEDAGLAKSLIC